MTKSVIPDSSFECAVCLLPEKFHDLSGLKRLVERELRTVRSCLLYADQVIVNSLALQAIDAFRIIIRKPRNKKEYREALKVIPRISSVFSGQQEARRIGLECEKFIQAERLTKQNKTTINNLLETIRPIAKQIVSETTLGEFDSARRSGLTHFKPIPFTGDHTEQAQVYLSNVLDCLSNPAVYPFLNQRLVKALRDSGRRAYLEPSKRQHRLRHVALAVDLIQRVPNLEHATVREIVALRKKLLAPLARFRSALANISYLMSAKFGDQDFDYELSDIYQFKVRPAVEEIREGLASSGLAQSIWHRTVVDPPYISKAAWGTGLGLGADEFLFGALQVPEQNVIATLAAVTGLSASVVTAAIDVRKARQSWRAHDMYFYFEARNRL